MWWYNILYNFTLIDQCFLCAILCKTCPMVLSKTEIGRIFRQPEIEDTIEDPNPSSCNLQRKSFFPQASFELCDAFFCVTIITLKSWDKLMTKLMNLRI